LGRRARKRERLRETELNSGNRFGGARCDKRHRRGDDPAPVPGSEQHHEDEARHDQELDLERPLTPAHSMTTQSESAAPAAGIAAESGKVVRVYRRRRWPARFFVGLFILDLPIVLLSSTHADRTRVAILFGIALGVCLVWLYASERRGVRVRTDGISIAPAFAPAREYQWELINGFYVRDWSRGEVTGWRILDKLLIVFLSFSPNGAYAAGVADRSAPTVMIDLQRQTHPMPLWVTRRRSRGQAAVQQTCDELNADMHRLKRSASGGH
jgi:hypothetical protein